MPGAAVRALLHEAAEATAPAASARLPVRVLDEAIGLAVNDDLLAPALGFRIVELDRPAAATLYAGGWRLEAPRLLPERGELTALACGVATIGARLEQQVSALFAERRGSLALALDDLGNRCLYVLSRQLQDRMMLAAEKRGLDIAGELRPGDPGLALDVQEAVLQLAQGDSIGVTVTPGLLLHPLKSISVVFGAGHDLPPARWSRCDDCRSRPTCRIAARNAEFLARA
ncbi:MAG: hypothetical protein R3D62_04505 [Xanthobacteraceae bacterium]